MSIQRCCVPARIARRDYTDEADRLRALSDPYRLKILASLAETDGDICVCDLTEALPLNQPTVSHHLKILRDAELVSCERRGTWVYYRLNPDARKSIADILGSIFRQKVSV